MIILSWFVYILLCGDGTFYTGVTLDLAKRLQAHQKGEGAQYTKGRQPLKLIYQESLKTRSEAQQREWQIKSLTKSQKKALTEGK